ncbi:MAG: NADP-dependent phosphogluconate dehydrogenase, partial [Eudoraea sp.]|nr:NADP-dependent phosphogluconate dehydrogenase [Eudoraea sp.]
MQNNAYDFGLVGLGVMGRNFILNVADNNYKAFGYDLDPEKVSALIDEGGDVGRVNASGDISTFVNALSLPRKIMLLVPAGKIVDNVIESLLPYLSANDIIIDGGNSFFTDTDRREAYLKSKGINFFGAGVSGGAEGARNGPSIMPGGSRKAYKEVQPIFEAVAAKFNNEPCVAYMGPKSAGNYVKMVHNGIEYGLMQLTAEFYDLLQKSGQLNNAELHKVYSEWNKGRLQSFLVEISAQIFKKEDPFGQGMLVDKILDKARQKGTGKWTSQNAMDIGIPIPTIDIAVSMREISALKPERVLAAKKYDQDSIDLPEKQELISNAEKALYFAFIITYAQGMHQLKAASDEYGYELSLK